MGDTMLYLLDSLMQSKEKVLKLEQIIKSEFNGTFVESTASHCWPALRTCLSTKASVRPSRSSVSLQLFHRQLLREDP